MRAHAAGIAAWFIYNVFEGQGYSRNSGVLVVARLCASAIIVSILSCAYCHLLACLSRWRALHALSAAKLCACVQVASMTLLLPVTYKMMDALR
jgi:hypothetical protein